MGAPYYGAYFATLALAGADSIAPLDDQTTPYAAYAIYRNGSPVRVLLYNSDYYVPGSRNTTSFTLSGLTTYSVWAKRLTAPFATSRQDQGQNPTVQNLMFTNGTCVVQGYPLIEVTMVSAGQATFTVAASEALLIYLETVS